MCFPSDPLDMGATPQDALQIDLGPGSYLRTFLRDCRAEERRAGMPPPR